MSFSVILSAQYRKGGIGLRYRLTVTAVWIYGFASQQLTLTIRQKTITVVYSGTPISSPPHTITTTVCLEWLYDPIVLKATVVVMFLLPPRRCAAILKTIKFYGSNIEPLPWRSGKRLACEYYAQRTWHNNITCAYHARGAHGVFIISMHECCRTNVYNDT